MQELSERFCYTLAGDAVCETVPHKFKCPFKDYVWQSRQNCVVWKDLAGNAMHTAVLGYVMLYLLATVYDMPQDFPLARIGAGSTYDPDDSDFV